MGRGEVWIAGWDLPAALWESSFNVRDAPDGHHGKGAQAG